MSLQEELGEEDQDMQGMRKEEESRMGARNFPEPCCDSRKQGEPEHGASPAPSASSRSPEQRDSDCLPSVVLAAFLTLVFVVVSVLLLHHESYHFCSDRSRPLPPGQVFPLEGQPGSLRRLLQNQPEAVRHARQQPARSRLRGPHPGFLLAVGFGEANGTRLSLTEAALLLLTQERAVWLCLPAHGAAQRSQASLRAGGTHDLAVAAICAGRDLGLGGLMLPLQGSVGGRKRPAGLAGAALVLHVSEQAQEELLLLLTMPSLPDILNAISFAKGGPMTTKRSTLVLLVKPRHSLEGRFARQGEGT